MYKERDTYYMCIYIYIVIYIYIERDIAIYIYILLYYCICLFICDPLRSSSLFHWCPMDS